MESRLDRNATRGVPNVREAFVRQLKPVRRRTVARSMLGAIAFGTIAGSLACIVVMLARPTTGTIPMALVALLAGAGDRLGRRPPSTAVLEGRRRPCRRPLSLAGQHDLGPRILERARSAAVRGAPGPQGAGAALGGEAGRGCPAQGPEKLAAGGRLAGDRPGDHGLGRSSRTTSRPAGRN